MTPNKATKDTPNVLNNFKKSGLNDVYFKSGNNNPEI